MLLKFKRKHINFTRKNKETLKLLLLVTALVK